MASSRPVSHWIGQLRAGDQVAAQHLWEGCFRRLVGLARGKSQSLPCRADDQEAADLRKLRSGKRKATPPRRSPPSSGASSHR